jgi:hypothetical protein
MKIVNMKLTTIPCPEENCDVNLGYDDVKQGVDKDVMWKGS